MTDIVEMLRGLWQEGEDGEPIIMRRQDVAEAANKIERLREWQPIETAPSDGSCVILHVKSHAPLGPNRFEFGRKGADGWYRQNLEKIDGAPIYWMPLPLPKKGSKDD